MSTTSVKIVRVEITDAELATCSSKSNKIRMLLANGWTRGEVAKRLEIRYQHVRNVELTPLKKV